MDKFSMLQTEIEKIIASLNKQIDTKSESIDILNCDISQDSEKREELNRNLEDLRNQRKIKNEMESQNIFTYTMKKEFNDMKAELKSCDKSISTLAIAASLVLLGFISLSNPIFLLIVLVYCLIDFFPEIIKSHKLKKKLSQANLEETISELESNINKLSEKIKNSNEKVSTLTKEIKALQEEKAYYERALAQIIESRSEIIARSATDILNAAFDENKFDDVIRKVREKKEGEYNGEII